MSKVKSHFEFSKGQRNGIFLLLFLILVFQCVYYFADFSSEEALVNNEELKIFKQELDSLKLVEIENRKPKIYPFNPNFITDYKGYTLGMTNEEIDRLLAFRKQDKWVNSAKDFQRVTKVSDSLLEIISPYFKFPDWVTNPKPKPKYTYSYTNKPKTFSEKQDLNVATAQQLKRVNGIGEKLSERIVKYRNSLPGGFISDVQLQEVYGLSPEVIVRVTNEFTVKTPKQIQKININTATIDELVTIQHIDYEIAHYIIEQRTLREGFKSLDELLKVKDFPVKKIEIIKLYLTLN
ncbi:ComEA family DNA-binding protein [Ichthyenterobacterium magnum]|uniref:DNA uptake protein ComE-like DNA-binding protein n=1 Tax=Ichthyenterobacterium magnum TaxID=1230530 RepID=A0A420DV16_9FLAO|nr:helix-hairpin-helix domain-containing protein [Ichthyenterobacterium magnum]RKE98085.1 DNA uptake protein ComE-like DNA-binding protein [Ichthyenterobacterium magnum]